MRARVYGSDFLSAQHARCARGHRPGQKSGQPTNRESEMWSVFTALLQGFSLRWGHSDHGQRASPERCYRNEERLSTRGSGGGGMRPCNHHPERVKKSTPAILSEAKDPGSFLWFSDLRTTTEILRCAQDDTFRISSHLPSDGAAIGPTQGDSMRIEVLLVTTTSDGLAITRFSSGPHCSGGRRGIFFSGRSAWNRALKFRIGIETLKA